MLDSQEDHVPKLEGPMFAKDDETGSANPDPTVRKLPGKPSGENVPPAGGESMSPADSKHPYPTPGGADADGDKD